jgi:amino-acid N-acetyltransferase
LLRRATTADLPAVRRLLTAAKLPLEGLDDHKERLWVWDQRGAVIGAIAYEAYGDKGLLRSLIVDPEHRGTGLGAMLLHSGLAEMRKAGLRDAYGLTTTIPDWLARLGWTEVEKESLPAALHKSMELRGACPDTARAFQVSLTTGR